MDEQNFESLSFITEPKLIDQFKGSRPKKKFLIFPEESDWNFTNLSCFINELDSFTKKKVIIELMNPNSVKIFILLKFSI